jgi:serine/threonine protein kinase
MSNSSLPLPAGSQIQEYVIEDVLGVGTFGITYKAMDSHLGISVVIKEYLPESFARRNGDNAVSPISEETKEIFLWGRERFLNEAKILAKFNHPNIVRVNRYFIANDTAYFVMDFAEGETLQSILAGAGRALSEIEIINTFTQVLSGLDIVHQQKYLHRDIKPGNIFIRKDKSAMLIDFGAARHEIPDDGSTTVQVTPGYAPVELYIPEDRKGPWTDLYSVGASLYRCLTQETPPISIERLKKMEDFGVDPCPSLGRDMPHLGSRLLLDSVDWMMSVAAEDRPQSVQEILDVWSGKKRRSNPVASRAREPVRDKVHYRMLVAGSSGGCIPTALQTLRDAGKGESAGQADAPPIPGLDSASLEISGHERITVYGITGREQFNAAQSMMKEGAAGLILLVDNAREKSLDELGFFMNQFSEFIEATGVVIGINRSELYPAPTIHDCHRHIAKSPGARRMPPPIMEVAPGNPGEMRKLLLSLLFHLNPSL